MLAVLQELAADRPGPAIAGVHMPEGAQELHDQTGHWPGLLGIEYCASYGCSPATSAAEAVPWGELNRGLYEHGEAGGLIRVLSHFPNPCRPELGGLRDADADVAAILTPDTPERGRWLALLDEIARGFLDLGRRGIPVLYGPLHEMNCPGFWWGLDHLQGSPERYRALYRDMVDRIRDCHGCDHVLWLWAPLAMSPVVPGAYPGDDVVDVVGLDVYDRTLTAFMDPYIAVSAIDKPFVLSEFGPTNWDATEPPSDPPYDCRRLLDELQHDWTQTVSFMFWGGCFLPSRQRNAEAMMNDTRAIDRETLGAMGR
jgi:mannan endo-1,4-beta-mannosidase